MADLDTIYAYVLNCTFHVDYTWAFDIMGGLAPQQCLQLYLILGVVAFQPLIIYWLILHLVW